MVNTVFCPAAVASLGPASFAIAKLVSFAFGAVSGGSGSPMAGERQMPMPPSGKTGANCAVSELELVPGERVEQGPARRLRDQGVVRDLAFDPGRNGNLDLGNDLGALAEAEVRIVAAALVNIPERSVRRRTIRRAP